jgi:threonine/homoserine/homoserine lactone efflux protein
MAAMSSLIGNHFPAYLSISALIIMTPGPDTALTIRNTLRSGRRGGVLTALGVTVGQVIWTVTTSPGLATVLLRLRPVFSVVQLLGVLDGVMGMILIGLGFRLATERF